MDRLAHDGLATITPMPAASLGVPLRNRRSDIS